MPPVIIGAAFAAGLGAAAGITVLGLSVALSAAVIFAANVALGFVMQALAPKPKSPNLDGFGSVSRDFKRTFRQPISPWRLVYGEQRVAGPLTFIETTDNETNLHMIITVAAHPVEKFGDVRVGDVIIHQSQLDSDGVVQTGEFANIVRVQFDHGSTGVAFPDLASAVTGWTSAHRQSNRAKMYFRLTHQNGKFLNGIPNLSAWVWGKKLVDPRESSAVIWTNNPALFPRDYILASSLDGGLAASTVEIDDTTFTSVANTSDEIVSTSRSTAAVHQVLSVSASTDFVTLAASAMILQTGDRVHVSATASAPGGVSPATSYFIVVEQHSDPPKIGFASTLVKARSRTLVDITTAGEGSVVVVKTGEPRYAGGGVVTLDRQPRSILDDMLTAFGGRLTNAGARWKLFGAAWPGTPASNMLFDEDDLIGPLKIATRAGRRERFNSVKGVFESPENTGAPTDYPPVIVSAYVSADGGKRIFKEFDPVFTTRPHTATRLGRIELERGRREITVQMTTHLKGLRAQAGSIIALDNARMGFSAKTFEVSTWRLIFIGEDTPIIGCEMTGREIDSAVFAWTAADEGGDEKPAARTVLPNPNVIADPTSLALTTGTVALFLKLDGTIVSRIKTAWVDSASPFVDRHEIQSKIASTSVWEPNAHVEGSAQVAFIWDVEDGQVYDVRIRAVSRLGAISNWVTASATVVGKTELPSNTTGFSAQQNLNVVTFRWNQVPDADLAGYEIRYRAETFDWDLAAVLTAVTRGTLITNAGLPPGAWTVGLKARDTSGNYSSAAAEFSITVSNDNDVIQTLRSGPHWFGVKKGFIVHSVSGRLVPESSAIANTVDPFATMTPNPVASASYETTEMDLGFDSKSVRIWGDIHGALGPNESGPNGFELQIDHHDTATAYDGFELWTVGTADARFVKGLTQIRPASTGAAYVSGFDLTLDSVERTLATTLNASVGGTVVTFDPIFHSIKSANATADGLNKFAHRTSVTVSSMSVYVFNSAAVDVGGTVAVTVVGV